MKTSNKLLLAALILILVFMALSAVVLKVNVFGDVIQGDGNIRQENRQVGYFDRVEVSGRFQVNYTQESRQAVLVTGDNNLLEHILTEVSDGELRVFTRNRLQSRNLQIDLSSSDIRQIKAAAGAQFNAQNMIHSPVLTLLGSAGARIELEALVEELLVNLSAGSSARLSGQAQTVEVEASAGSQLDAFELEAQQVKVQASAGSRVNVNAQEELSVSGSAGSSIYYAGTPVINELNLSAGSAIHQRRP